jgi:ATP adenylyltransferase
MEYILDEHKHDSCLFCDVSGGGPEKMRGDAGNLVLYRARKCFVMLNKYPYNSGHVMVVPYFHTPSFDGLSDSVLADLIKTVRLSVDRLRTSLNPDGFNIGLNFGKVAGAGMESHMHIHIVPRWTGDTDSMPIIAETRIMPEHLKRTYNKLRRVFKRD